MKDRKVAVVGAGLVGSLWAVYLAKRGYQVDVFDRRSDIRKMKVVQGKSINLALSDRGWRGLEGAGLGEEIKEVALPMYGRLMHNLDGTETYQPYGQDGQAIYSVSRGVLNQTLVQCADRHDEVNLYFDHRCLDIDLTSNEIEFHNEATGENVRQKYDCIFGTDGAFSAVRTRLVKQERYDYSQTYLSHGYKELEIPANPDGTHQLRKDCLHIWPRGEFMMIALPNIDGSFTCTLFIAFEGKDSFENLKDEASVKAFFQKYFPDAMPLMPELTDDFFSNPNASLVMVKCSPWNYKGNVGLLGDACHAIVPFYGQGMNCGFEDCTVLNKMLDDQGDNLDIVLPEFSKQRKPDADAILELALRNYIEMRDLTADPDFLLQKKIEARFSKKYPDKWIPLYSQVTFSDIPYHIALANGDRQQSIMSHIMKMDNIEERWDSDDVENMILSLLP
jgi:kynurenine 3-monooxygenase